MQLGSLIEHYSRKRGANTPTLHGQSTIVALGSDLRPGFRGGAIKYMVETRHQRTYTSF